MSKIVWEHFETVEGVISRTRFDGEEDGRSYEVVIRPDDTVTFQSPAIPDGGFGNAEAVALSRSQFRELLGSGLALWSLKGDLPLAKK